MTRLTVSRNKQANNAKKHPKPMVRKKTGKIKIGNNSVIFEGVTFKKAKTAAVKAILINSSKIVCPILAMTKDILGKLILTTISPAETMLLVHATMPFEKITQIVNPTNANAAYGVSVVSMFINPERLKNTKIRRVIKGFINVQVIPRRDCLYLA